MKSGFKRTINLNKYQSEITIQEQNWYLDYLIDSKFQSANRLFVLSFEKNTGRKCYKQYYLPRKEIKHYNVMIDERSFFHQPVKYNLKKYYNIWRLQVINGMIKGLVVY